MAIADDKQLIQLAAQPAGELFPVLNRAVSLTPLLVLLAILPGIYALQYRTLDEPGALWALRSLDALTATNVEGVVDPGSGTPEREHAELGRALKWQPPLGSWLTALVMGVVGSSQPLSLVLVSYLATAGLIGMSYLLCRRLEDRPFGLWTALMLAAHGPLLTQVQSPAPYSLALLLALVAFWGFLSHLQETVGAVSARLGLGGVALGLCLLAGGPLALMVTAVLLLHVLGLRGECLDRRRDPSVSRERVWVGRPALKSLLLFGLTALAVGGWWNLLMFSRYGPEFLHGWFTGALAEGNGTLAAVAPHDREPFAAAQHSLETLGALLGLSLLGTWRACREMLTTCEEPKRRRMQFLLAWLGIGLFVWLNVLHNSEAGTGIVALWQGFLLIPALALAAFAVEEISRRRIRMLVVIGITGLTGAILLGGSFLPSSDNIEIAATAWSVTLVFGVFFIAAWWLGGGFEDRDARQRAFLSVLIVMQVAANAGAGLWSVRHVDEDDRALAIFREGLVPVRGVETCTIIRDRGFSFRLQWTLRSLWPHAELTAADSWDTALSQILTAPSRHPRSQRLVVDWSERGTRPTTLQVPGFEVSQVSTPQFFKGRPLRAYLLTDEREGMR